jgi:hypothetical protein
LAHPAYNRRDRAEVARRVTVPITVNGATVADVFEYRDAHAQPARHAFFGAE